MSVIRFLRRVLGIEVLEAQVVALQDRLDKGDVHQRLGQIEANLQVVHACVDCGVVVFIPSKRVGKVEVSPGQFEVRCHRCMDKYERDPRKHLVLIPGREGA